MCSRLDDNANREPEAREAFRKANLKMVRRVISRLYKRRHRLTKDHVDVERFARMMPINITRLPFDSDEIDFDVRFSKPLDKEKFDDIFSINFGAEGERLYIPKFSESEDSNRLYEMAFRWTGLISGAMRWAPRFDPATQTERDDPQLLDLCAWHPPEADFFGKAGDGVGEVDGPTEWDTESIYLATPDVKPKPDRAYDSNPPHVACVVGHHVPMYERLPRAELLSILYLLQRRLCYRGWNPHAIVPIFIYAFNDNEARVTQAHFDGKTLHLRQTEPVLLIHEPLSKIKTLLRWVMAEPLGDTLYHDPGKPVDRQASGAPSTPKSFAIRRAPPPVSTFPQTVLT